MSFTLAGVDTLFRILLFRYRMDVARESGFACSCLASVDTLPLIQRGLSHARRIRFLLSA
jgi:hypothetical protein